MDSNFWLCMSNYLTELLNDGGEGRALSRVVCPAGFHQLLQTFGEMVEEGMQMWPNPSIGNPSCNLSHQRVMTGHNSLNGQKRIH